MLRIFSKNKDINYNDHIKNIKGKTILSDLKTNNNNSRSLIVNKNKIVSYLSYNDFLVITQTFYKFSNLKKKYKPPQKIIDLKTSFLFYNKILNHMQNCDFCKTNTIETFFKECKEIKNILYPYGEYFTYEIYSNLSSVDLDYWCSKACINNILCEGNHNPVENNQVPSNNDLSSELSKYSYSNSLTNNDSHSISVEKPFNVSYFDSSSVSSYKSSSNTSNTSITSNSLSSYKLFSSNISDDSSIILSNIDSSSIEPNIYSNFKSESNSLSTRSGIQPIFYQNVTSNTYSNDVSSVSSNDLSSVQPNVYSNFKSIESSSVSSNSGSTSSSSESTSSSSESTSSNSGSTSSSSESTSSSSESTSSKNEYNIFSIDDKSTTNSSIQQPNFYSNFKSENEPSSISCSDSTINSSSLLSNDLSRTKEAMSSNFKINIQSNYLSDISSYNSTNSSSILSNDLLNKKQIIQPYINPDVNQDYNVNSNYKYKSVEKSHNNEPNLFSSFHTENTQSNKYNSNEMNILNENWCKNNQEKFIINNKPNITFDKQIINNINNRSNYVVNTIMPGNKTTFNIFIAELTNEKDYAYKEKNIDFETENKFYNVYNFIPIYLNFDELKNIFFNSNTKYFNISDIISEKIKLSNQYFENINNELQPFITANSIKKIYIEKNNYNEMDANTIIEIEKESQDFVSLYDFNYITNSLNLDDLIHIINKNNIDLDCDIKIKIKVYYKSKKTDIPCIMYFNYILQNIK